MFFGDKNNCSHCNKPCALNDERGAKMYRWTKKRKPNRTMMETRMDGAYYIRVATTAAADEAAAATKTAKCQQRTSLSYGIWRERNKNFISSIGA